MYKRRRLQRLARLLVGELRRDTESGDTFICYDPEGYLWCIGTYNPWQTNAQTQAPAAE